MCVHTDLRFYLVPLKVTIYNIYNIILYMLYRIGFATFGCVPVGLSFSSCVICDNGFL